MSFPPSPRLACPPPVSVPPWAYLYVLPVCSLFPLHDSSFPVHFPIPPRAPHLPCCPSVSSTLSAARPPVFSPLHTHSRHTVQQQTNHAVAASASALKQMAELLRGCSRVCSLGRGVGRQMLTTRLLGAEVARSSVHWAAGRTAVQVPWAPGLLGKSALSPCPALRAPHPPATSTCALPATALTVGLLSVVTATASQTTAPSQPPCPRRPSPLASHVPSSPGRLSVIHTLPAPPEVGGAQSMQCC